MSINNLNKKWSNVTLDHKSSLDIFTGIFCSNSQIYIVWVKIMDFYFMPKIIRILSIDHDPEDIAYISYVTILKRLLVVCVAKNFIWTTLNAIFSIFRFFLHPQIPDFNSCISVKYCHILTNHTSMESYLFSVQMKHKSEFKKSTLMSGFVVQARQANKWCLGLKKTTYIIHIVYYYLLYSPVYVKV